MQPGGFNADKDTGKNPLFKTQGSLFLIYGGLLQHVTVKRDLLHVIHKSKITDRHWFMTRVI